MKRLVDRLVSTISRTLYHFALARIVFSGVLSVTIVFTLAFALSGGELPKSSSPGLVILSMLVYGVSIAILTSRRHPSRRSESSWSPRERQLSNEAEETEEMMDRIAAHLNETRTDKPAGK